MTIVLLAAVAAVAGIGVFGVARRNLADERSSVRHYQHTVEALRHVSDHGDEPAREVPVRSGHPAAAAPVPAEPALFAEPSSEEASDEPALFAEPVAQRSPPEAPAERTARFGPARLGVRVDAPPAPLPATRATTAADAVRQLIATVPWYGSGSKQPAMPRSRRRDRRPLLTTVAAVVVVGTLTGVAVALRPAPRSVATSPVVHHHRATSHVGAKRSSSSKKSAAAAAVVPSGLVPVTASTTEATYDVAAAPYSVTLSARGPCWVEAVDVSTGLVLWEGTLEAGQTQTVPATAGLFLRLGNTPQVTVTEGGQTVQLPVGYSTVFNLTFVTA